MEETSFYKCVTCSEVFLSYLPSNWTAEGRGVELCCEKHCKTEAPHQTTAHPHLLDSPDHPPASRPPESHNNDWMDLLCLCTQQHIDSLFSCRSLLWVYYGCCNYSLKNPPLEHLHPLPLETHHCCSHTISEVPQWAYHPPTKPDSSTMTNQDL